MIVKKTAALLLLAAMLLSCFSMTAFAVDPIVGDVNGDGKITPYDALQVQAYLHGEISLSDAQIARAVSACPSVKTLSTAHIVAIFFKPLTGQNAQAPEADGLYHIRSASDMALLCSFPYAGFSLDADIDMTDYGWTPVVFGGVLLGNGHTISNLSVTAESNNVNAGALFVKLGAENNRMAAVCDLRLENTALTTSNTHQYVGLVCGTNYGTIVNVPISGGAIGGMVNAVNAVGAYAGLNYGSVSADGELSLNVSYAASSQGIVGRNAAGAQTELQNVVIRNGDGIFVDYEIRDAEPLDRQTVVNKMYDMSQVQWKVQEPSLFKESDFVFNILAGRVYTGMPYSHATGTLEHIEASSVLIENGVHTINNDYTLYIEGTTASSSTNVPMDALILGHVMGHDCSSAVAAAWRTVSPKAGFERTTSLVPTPEHCAKFGLINMSNLPLTKGSYTSWDLNFDQNHLLTGDDVGQRNYQYVSVVSNDDGSINPEKLSALYEAYAQCQPGDAIVYYCRGYMGSDKVMRTAGHARLVSGYPIVVRDGAGRIDPVNSYLIVTEQGTTNPNKINKKNNNTYSTWYVDYRYSFQKLAGIETAKPTEKHYAVYLPVTSVDYLSPYRERTQFKLANFSSPLSGVVSSNYGIIYTELTIDGVSDKQFTGQYGRGVGNDGKTYAPYDGLDDSGTTTYAQLRENATGSFTANRFLYKSVNLEKHAPQFASLASGTHTYTLTVKITTGETKTYSGTFSN